MLNYLKNSEAANEAAETALAALRNENMYVRTAAAEVLGEVKVGTTEMVSGLLAALRDESYYVRSSAAGGVGELSKNRKAKLPRELIILATVTMREMLDDPRNQGSEFGIAVGGRYYSNPVDVIWEALWLVCQRMDEQRR